MTKTLKDLALAMLNATLILVVIILVLVVMILNKADDISTRYTETVTAIAPLEKGFETLRTEVGAIQSDIAALRGQSDRITTGRLDTLQQNLAKMNTQLEEIDDSLKTVSETPQRVLDDAIALVADQAVIGAAKLRGCTMTPDA